MSQENVELVREGFARWNEGDYDFFFDSPTPDIELLSRFGSLRGEPYRGREGVREWLADIQQSFERFDLWLDDVRDLGDDVLALGGIELQRTGKRARHERADGGWVFEIRDRRLGANAVLCATVRSPRSRRAVGVGDVAGERRSRCQRA